MSDEHPDHNEHEIEHFEEFDEFGDEDLHQPPKPQGLKERFLNQWNNNAGFKFGVIAAAVVAVAAGAWAFMGNQEKPVAPGTEQSHVGNAENVKGTVGADVSPEYRNLLQNDNQQRAKEALQTGQSAMPTPVGNVATTTPPKEQPVDPLAMWRQQAEQQPKPAPTAILQQEAPANNSNNNQAAQQQQQAQQQDLQARTQAIATQINSLMQAWQPGAATVVAFQTQNQNQNNANNNNGANGNNNNGNGANNPTASTKVARVIVPAGDILYGSMITEANSDVPGPILAQILSGPLKDGRLIGSFQVSDDYLVLQFKTLSIHGHSYSVDAIALDPNTTLGGMATETDQRYFSRVVIPAAANFVSQFGQAISQAGSTTTVSNGTVIVSQPSINTRQALYAGAGNAANSVANFATQEAGQIKPLVRVASNTPIGIFFTSPVTDQPRESQTQ